MPLEELDPSQWSEVAQPQTHPNAHPNRAAQNDHNSNASINHWAVANAIDLGNEIQRQGGGIIYTDDFNKMVEKNVADATDTQRQVQLQDLRIQEELAKSKAEKEWEAKRTGLPLTDEQRKEAAGYANAQDVLLNLGGMHKDALKNGVYGKWTVGDATKSFYDATDPNVRAYEAALTGASTQIAKGVFGEASTQASEQATRTLLKDTMPGSGDDESSGAKKLITLLGNTLNNQKNFIQSLRGRYDTSDLQNQYTAAYNRYLPMLKQFGTDAQKQRPAVSPEELFGGPEAEKKLIASGPAPILPASTRVGMSDSTDAALTAATMPQYMVGRVPQLPSGDVWSKAAATAAGAPVEPPPDLTGRIPELGDVSQWRAMGKIDPQAAQALRERQKAEATTTAQALPGQVLGALQGAALGPTPLSPQQVGQGVGGALNWLQRLLPENWPQNQAGQLRP
jgi:hypothetical protein